MNHHARQWQLCSQLIESCLLEQWIADDKITLTTPWHYEHQTNLRKAVAQLPRDHQSYFLQAYAQPKALLNITESELGESEYPVTKTKPLMVIALDASTNLLLIVEPAYCTPWRAVTPFFPIRHQHQTYGSNKTLEVVDDASILLTTLLSLLSENLSLDGQLANDDQHHFSSSQTVSVGIEKLKDSLRLAQTQLLWSSQAILDTCVYRHRHGYQTLIASEQWASLVDRPFHPLAKCKVGLNHQDYRHYMAEFGQPIDLDWFAVAKTHLMVSSVVRCDDPSLDRDIPVRYFLTATQRAKLDDELTQLGLSQSHIALPVHPWQVTSGLMQDWFASELSDGIIVALKFKALQVWASASIRSLLLASDTPHSIKLPLGVYALNSKRYLPALKLINGQKNQALVEQACKQDDLLDAQLWLWDESRWWGYMPPAYNQNYCSDNAGFFQEKPTHLGAMLRTLPQSLCQDDVKLITMASLGVVKHNHAHDCHESHNTQNRQQHIFDEIIASQGKPIDLRFVTACFERLCTVFFSVMLRCLNMGFLPELHGQNVVLVLKHHDFVGILLRDHDSVRIHLPWLKQHHLLDPEYLSPPDFRNRLYRDKPEDLIGYLQSLGILVNIRAIIEAVVARYSLKESMLWQQVRLSIEACLQDIDFTDEQRHILQSTLLNTRHYPHKTLLLPVIERADNPHGSMPEGQSTTHNPLQVCLLKETQNDPST